MASQPIATSVKIRSLSLPILEALRELTDRLSVFSNETDQANIYSLNTDLKGIGWTSLFVSDSIDRFLQIETCRRGAVAGGSRDEYSCQLDSLLVAAKYLERSVKNLKEVELEMPDLSKDQQVAFACLVENLQEIICECQRSAN
jgi:hypothetical protein